MMKKNDSNFLLLIIYLIVYFSLFFAENLRENHYLSNKVSHCFFKLLIFHQHAKKIKETKFFFCPDIVWTASVKLIYVISVEEHSGKVLQIKKICRTIIFNFYEYISFFCFFLNWFSESTSPFLLTSMFLFHNYLVTVVYSCVTETVNCPDQKSFFIHNISDIKRNKMMQYSQSKYFLFKIFLIFA